MRSWSEEESHPPSSSDVFLQKYIIVGKLGEGSFGCVKQAIRRDNGQVVALKMIKEPEAASSTNSESLIVREVEALIQLRYHPNIIQLQDIIQQGHDVTLVFEYMNCDLHKYIINRAYSGSYVQECEIRRYCFQILNGVYNIHNTGYIHRDLKPGNLLLNTHHQLKVADLGSAQKYYSDGRAPPSYTDYVTRHYRAPEVLLFGGHYGPAMDMWAVGALMAELYTLQPIFPGTSSKDQIHKICDVMGTPHRSWPLGSLLAQATGFEFPQSSPEEVIPLSKLIPHASKAAIDLITSLLSWDPLKRPTALEALQHRFFQPLNVPSAPRCSNVATDQSRHHVIPPGFQKLSLPLVL